MSWSTSMAGSIGMGITFIVLILIGLTGNMMVCLAIYTNRKLRKKENFYFVSLAIADLLLCVLVMPFAAYNDAIGCWPFGEYCKYWISLDIMCCTSSILHLCSISFDRCYHIHYPMQYGQRMTDWKILSAIFIVWTLSAGVAFGPLAFESRFHRALQRTNSTTFLVDSSFLTSYRCNFNLDPSYAVISSLVSFYIPSCVMIVAYTKLYKYARKHAKSIRHQLRTATTLLINVANRTSNEEKKKRPILHIHHSSFSLNTHRHKIGASDAKARITLGVILGFFIFSWGPFFISNIARSFCGTDCVPNSLFVALTWMGYANSAQNPIIYSIFNRDFREAFSKILLCKEGRRKSMSLAVNNESIFAENGCNRRECRPFDLIDKGLSHFSFSEPFH